MSPRGGAPDSTAPVTGWCSRGGKVANQPSFGGECELVECCGDVTGPGSVRARRRIRWRLGVTSWPTTSAPITDLNSETAPRGEPTGRQQIEWVSRCTARSVIHELIGQVH